MKKIIAISMVAVSLAATSAFGQGYFLFTAGKSQAFDGFTTPGVSATSVNVKTAFLWAPASTASTMVASGLPGSSVTGGNSTTTTSYTAAQAWAAILNVADTFTLAQKTTDDVNGTPIAQNTAANGGISFNGGVSFDVLGTAPSTTYTLIIFGWDGAFATPALAAAANAGAGAAVGWSTAFQYSAVTSIGTPTSMAGLGANFGNFIPFAPVPEPATIALAGLGGLSLLALRRKK